MKHLLIPALLLAGAVPAVADVVVRRNGSQVEGQVLSVDATSVVVKTARGNLRLERAEIESIQFVKSDAVAPPLRVEIRNVQSDDEVDVLFDGETVIRGAREGGDWIDLTPLLKDGNNELRLRIRNDRGTWAYRLSLRINGVVTPIECGTPNRSDDPCRCCGKTGVEKGIIDDLPIVWIHVDRALGRAEVEP